VNVRAIGGAALLVLTAPISLTAHHSLTAEYDPNTPVTIVGRISKLEWINPHPFLGVECTTPEGGREHWRVETGAPGALEAAGVSRDLLAVGTAVTINGVRAKNGSLRAWGLEITFPDGSTKRLDARVQPVSEDALPSLLERILVAQPALPYVVGALPVAVLLVGGLILWWRRP
jgi:hypothetical protein